MRRLSPRSKESKLHAGAPLPEVLRQEDKPPGLLTLHQPKARRGVWETGGCREHTAQKGHPKAPTLSAGRRSGLWKRPRPDPLLILERLSEWGGYWDSRWGHRCWQQPLGDLFLPWQHCANWCNLIPLACYHSRELVTSVGLQHLGPSPSTNGPAAVLGPSLPHSQVDPTSSYPKTGPTSPPHW